MAKGSWTAKLIVEQQDMSVATLAGLHEYGVIDDITPLRLDFAYGASSEAAAQELADFLSRQTDYTVGVVRGPRGLHRRGWIVKGQTRETTVSIEILHRWIRWMVGAGAENGACRFDGWGAAVPT